MLRAEFLQHGLQQEFIGLGYCGSFTCVTSATPVTAGFISKVLFASSSFRNDTVMMFITFSALIISTLLNAVYFIHTVVTIYSRNEEHYQYKPRKDFRFISSTILLVALNILLGVIPATVVHVLTHGISNFF